MNELEYLDRELREWRIKRDLANSNIDQLEKRKATILSHKKGARKCQACGQYDAVTAWQPFGPEPNCRDDGAFAAPGSHYRGFPVLKICDDCQGEIQNGECVTFEYGKNHTAYRLIGELAPMTEHEYQQYAKESTNG